MGRRETNLDHHHPQFLFPRALCPGRLSFPLGSDCQGSSARIERSGRLREEHRKFESSLGNIARACPNQQAPAKKDAGEPWCPRGSRAALDPARPLPRTFEGHDRDLDARAVQPPQPLGLRLAVLAEVEARGEDAQAEVRVPAQEVGHVPRAVVAGAPGREPGDAVAAARVQVPVGDVAQEQQLHVAAGLRAQRGVVTARLGARPAEAPWSRGCGSALVCVEEEMREPAPRCAWAALWSRRRPPGGARAREVSWASPWMGGIRAECGPREGSAARLRGQRVMKRRPCPPMGLQCSRLALRQDRKA